MSPPISSVQRSPLGAMRRTPLGVLGSGGAEVQCLVGTAGYSGTIVLGWTAYGFETSVGGATDADLVGGGPAPTETDAAPLGWRRLSFQVTDPDVLPEFDVIKDWWFSGRQSGVWFSPSENANPSIKYQEWDGAAPGPFGLYTETAQPPIQEIGTIELYENFYRMRTAQSNRRDFEVYGNVGYTGAVDPIDLGFFEGEDVDICNVPPPPPPYGYDLVRVDPFGWYVCPDVLEGGVGCQVGANANEHIMSLTSFDPVPRWPDVQSAVSVTVQAPNDGTIFGPIPMVNNGLGPDGQPCKTDFGSFRAHCWPFDSNREMSFSIAQEQPGFQLTPGAWQFTFNFS